MMGKRKLISIFFLQLGLLPWLFICSFYLRQNQIRNKMKEKFETGAPHQRLSIPDHAINWVKTGKEIVVNGKMFDIKTAYSENGITHFTGLFDEEETLLKKHWQEGWNRQSSLDTSLITQFINFILSIFRDSGDHASPVLLQIENYYSTVGSKLPQEISNVLTPPPKASC